jgi:anti-sigma regulatory factor (Ser/Thr protein kinase)
MSRRLNQAVREFILRQIPAHAGDIASVTAQRFGISREAVRKYLKRLVADRLVAAGGRTNAREYRLMLLDSHTVVLDVSSSLQEDVVWREELLPRMNSITQNVVDICEYGFNEMVNNVVDHSGSKSINIEYERDYSQIRIYIRDYGIGIFEKVRSTFNLHDRKQALLELSKGKLTTDKERHTGEGIFFTSRLFDKFSILSLDLYYSRSKEHDSDWLIESESKDEETLGTCISMVIATDAAQVIKEVFSKYMDDDLRFSRTHVPLILAKYEGEKLVSRSQAKRLLARVDRFSEVILDFKGISEIGQAFADEIFRVFQKSHPSIKMIPMRTNEDVDRMIKHALANAASSDEPGRE